MSVESRLSVLESRIDYLEDRLTEILELGGTTMRSEPVGAALGVPGHVNLYEIKTQQEVITECKLLLDKFESHGIHNLGDIPECDDKIRLRNLFLSLGFEADF